ncbi:MAG: 3'(2'),5'-bisphosphate nucleotidase CysQ [Phenylobacterium sp.]|uniref:3'(2'),5'-bisphosphate nucleotidase CysQ n=1 Tax=Phenylobacterium sp. TaxID=1871053 RepID=UPI0025F69731|nr:3'(2'),5'-bisphosphate nucleotidase CysQ [Phenylobacterium sp.]MCG9917554.1 3'(2'),5'-bisphosphate nucleotidase CysQ [Phenylobacterium sp.]
MPQVYDLSEDARLASALARQAGQLLLTARNLTTLTDKSLGALGDAVGQQFLSHSLSALRPDDAVLSEEAADDATRLTHSRVWIIDPLDGTREFSEGRDDWAVHVALCIDGHPTIGAVALPDLGVVLDTAHPPPMPHAPDGLKILVSRSRPPEVASRAAELLGAELVGMGSAGAKVMGVVRGQAHAYVHAGGQYEWDSAAPVAVALAAGFHVSRLDGTPMTYNQQDTYLPDLVVCRPELKDRLMAAVG